MNSSFENIISKLRFTYVYSAPRQRLKVVLDRIAFPEHEPSLLITRVSAVEALARSLVVHHFALAGENLDKVYAQYRNTGPEELLNIYLMLLNSKSASQFFGADAWVKFHQAVKYRNLMVHECSYLDPSTALPLLETCRTMLRQLAEAANLPTDKI